MTTKAEHIDTLARTLYGEAKPHDVQDATAIACVVMNRVALPNWPNDVEAVCIQPYQFSCWNTSDPNRARIFRAAGIWFDKCVEIATQAVGKRLADTTKRSTHYHTPAVKPAWSQGKKPVYSTSGHVFFNDIDTKPPATAQDALNQIKPIGKTDTMVATKIGGVASVGIGAVSQAIETLEPALPLATTLAKAAPWAIVAVLALVLLYIAWSRYQARKEGKI
jgi:N-acetylmuramoyl-L-alanine amidase